MRKLFAVLLVFCLLFSFSCFAEELMLQNEDAKAYENKDVIIKYNDKNLNFYTANKDRVYPLTYNNSTYLPIRAISSMYYVPILWDGMANTIHLNSIGQIDSGACEYVEGIIKEGLEIVDVVINKQIKVLYDNAIADFYDANGEKVYPISFKHTTYLPIRAIANLFGFYVDYDAEANTVLLGDQIINEPINVSGDLYALDNVSDDTEFTYMKTNFTINQVVSGDINFRIGGYNEALCWGINLYKEDPITGKNIYEDELDVIYDEIDEKASGDKLNYMLLIQKYNLDNYMPSYYEKPSGDYYFHVGKIYIVNGGREEKDLKAKNIKVLINEDYEKDFVLDDTNQSQYLDIDYYQYDITKTVDITFRVLDAYTENSEDSMSGDIYILDITPHIDSNIPQGR